MHGLPKVRKNPKGHNRMAYIILEENEAATMIIFFVTVGNQRGKRRHHHPLHSILLEYGLPATQIWHSQLVLLALEAPCAMPMCPARHYEMLECGVYPAQYIPYVDRKSVV